MVIRILILAALAAALLGSDVEASARKGAAHLQAGDSLPLLVGPSLGGTSVDLPSAAGGHPAVVLFSFSRDGGQRVQDWTRHLLQEMPDLNVYSVNFLEAVPGPFRGIVVSRIKSNTPQQQQDRTLLLYSDTNTWKQQLQNCDIEDDCVLLLGPDSRIRWMTGGAFTANNDHALLSQLKTIGHE